MLEGRKRSLRRRARIGEGDEEGAAAVKWQNRPLLVPLRRVRRHRGLMVWLVLASVAHAQSAETSAAEGKTQDSVTEEAKDRGGDPCVVGRRYPAVRAVLTFTATNLVISLVLSVIPGDPWVVGRR